MDALNARTPEDLALEARAGSLPCFDELARRFQVPLLHFLSGRTGRLHEAEDLVQETFLRAFTSLEQYDPAYAFKSWLFTIAYNLSIDRARSPAASTVPLKLAGEKPLPATERAGSDLWDLAKRELSAEQFAALWLFYGEELSVAEVAKVLSRTKTGVKVILFRARRALERRLRESGSIRENARAGAIQTAAPFRD